MLEKLNEANVQLEFLGRKHPRSFLQLLLVSKKVKYDKKTLHILQQFLALPSFHPSPCIFSLSTSN